MEEIFIYYNTDAERNTIFELANEEDWEPVLSTPLRKGHPQRPKYRYLSRWKRETENSRGWDCLSEELKANLRKRSIADAANMLRTSGDVVNPLTTPEARFLDEMRAEELLKNETVL
jgi:hypothetical protein